MAKTATAIEQPGTLETDAVEVRNLSRDDVEWIVRIDAQHSGRPRPEYYRLKLQEAEKDTGIRISLGAFINGVPAGFLTGRTYYGEFGVPEPVAILDSIGVAKSFARQHVGRALMRQLRLNLRALRIDTLRTQLDWNHWELLRFFEKQGFQPAPRVCLDLDISDRAMDEHAEGVN